MCKGLSPDALQFSGSCVLSDTLCQRLLLVVSLVLSRLDYGNAVLVGLLAYLLRRLQSVMNAAARLIFGLRRTDHFSNALIILHWLRAQERVLFKMAMLMYKASHGAAPLYLSHLVRVAYLPGRRCLRSAGQRDLCSVSFNLPSASENISLPGLVS